jgi:16S rRNA processing protein RimM
MSREASVVLVGRLAGAYGIKGWVKLSSFTQPAENILDYMPWQLRRRETGEVIATVNVQEGRLHGKGLIARIDSVSDRDQAADAKGLEIVVDRQQLPDPGSDQFYWADLEGMTVETLAGQQLGQVDHMLEAGAADVMVVSAADDSTARKLIPFIRDDVIVSVDLDAGVIRVNWDEEDSE